MGRIPDTSATPTQLIFKDFAEHTLPQEQTIKRSKRLQTYYYNNNNYYYHYCYYYYYYYYY